MQAVKVNGYLIDINSLTAWLSVERFQYIKRYSDIQSDNVLREYITQRFFSTF